MSDIIINDLLIDNINRVFGQIFDKSDIFYRRYYIYRHFLTNYLIGKYNLKEYDKRLLESNLNYLAIKPEKMDFYQDFSKSQLKYFYIRNELYLDNLPEEEVAFLDKCISNFDIDGKTIFNYIEKTYKKVITKHLNVNTKYKVFFGPDSKNFMANDGDVVIGVRYDEFNLNGLSDTEWNDLHDRQIDYLNKIINEVQQKFPNEVKIIKYNEYSTF